MSRPHQERLSGHAKAFWDRVERASDRLGQGRGFSDFLDAAAAALSQMPHLARGQKDAAVEADYERAVAGYDADGRRLLSEAFGVLVVAAEQTPDHDVLGEVFQARVTFGEHGQFFTPWHVCELLARMQLANAGDLASPSVFDPCVGSGRMLLAAKKAVPSARLHGQDVDRRCCLMTAINLWVRGYEGVVTQGNSLANEVRARWAVTPLGLVDATRAWEGAADAGPAAVAVGAGDGGGDVVAPVQARERDHDLRGRVPVPQQLLPFAAADVGGGVSDG